MTAWPLCWKAWWVISGNGSDPAHGSRCSCSPSSQMPVDEDGSIPGLTPVRALAVTPCLSLSLSLTPALSFWPQNTTLLSRTLARNLTYLLLITYPLSSSSFTFSLQFHIPLSLSPLPLIFIPIIFFGHSFPHFPLAYYLLYLPCPLCGFTPSISCFLLPAQAQFPPSLPFPHLCFFSFCYSSATFIP